MKYKTIKISEELHKKIKKFCDEEGLKLNQSCELWLGSQILYAMEYAKLKNAPKGSGESSL